MSARWAALPSTLDFIFSDSSIIFTIFSNLLSFPTLLTVIVSVPSSITVPAYTDAPSAFLTAVASPVSDAWLTSASPSATTPSNGMTLPICTTTCSPVSISSTDTRTSVPSTFFHAFVTCKDRLLARLSIDFLCVHSSSSSPKPSRNMIEPAVSVSFLKTDTAIAVASSTGTSIFPFRSVFTPSFIYFSDCQMT